MGRRLLRWSLPCNREREEGNGEDENQISEHEGILNEMTRISKFQKCGGFAASTPNVVKSMHGKSDAGLRNEAAAFRRDC